MNVWTMAAAAALAAGAAQAHYGMIIPSDPMLSQEDGRAITLELSFSHPFERAGMTLARPAAFGVVAAGEPVDLLDRLEPATLMGQDGFSLDFDVDAPGTYVFHMEPLPYWEPAEDAFIVHYTKTYVTAYGDDAGWDRELGLKTEIVPMSKPFALWAGNVFQGVVKLDGAPVPYAEVEVEFYDERGTAVAPDALMITQTVKADANGVFTYAAPRAGWWGFAALNTADYTIAHEGAQKAVELGAVIWVRFEDWATR